MRVCGSDRVGVYLTRKAARVLRAVIQTAVSALHAQAVSYPAVACISFALSST